MKCYVVDAFTDVVFKGNPAAICVVSEWPSIDLMKNIAMENNLSETAFIKKNGDKYDLRWFTPTEEVDLCGHATLAAAYVLMGIINMNLKEVSFSTLSGILTVKKKDDLYEMDLPAYDLKRVPITKNITEVLGFTPLECLLGRDLVCVTDRKENILNFMPESEKIKTLDGMLLHITSQGDDFDCVTRSFAPKIGILEDPVCGSGHCHVIPFWSEKLGKENLIAYQASKRSGVLHCCMSGNRVYIAGNASLYSIAELFLP